VYQFVPWTLIKEIGVMNDSIKIKVQTILQNYQDCTFVKNVLSGITDATILVVPKY
jgi:hypothetical protein